MKITKYPQSHLVLEKEGKKLIIDPGYLSAKAGFTPEQFQDADIYLITHQHADHLDPENIKQIIQDKPVYANSDVIAKLIEVGVESGIEVQHLEEFKSGGFKIKAVNLPHFPPPNGSVPPPNTGFLIDGIFFHSGDGMELHDEIYADNASIALGMPNVSESSIKNVREMLIKLDAKAYIPIHYDAHPANPHDVEQKLADLADVIILKDKEHVEIG